MRLFLSLIFVLFCSLTRVQAAPWLIADIDSGHVIAAEQATDPWHPASVTKLMTVYLALKAVKMGRVSLNTALTVSEHAASMPPSKIGIKPGGTLTLDAALKILLVKSANKLQRAIWLFLVDASFLIFRARRLYFLSRPSKLANALWTIPMVLLAAIPVPLA